MPRDTKANKLAWKIYERLAEIGCGIGNASVSHIEREVKAFVAEVELSAFEQAAQVADTQAEKYSEDGHFGWHRRDEAQDIAAAIRALKPEK